METLHSDDYKVRQIEPYDEKVPTKISPLAVVDSQGLPDSSLSKQSPACGQVPRRENIGAGVMLSYFSFKGILYMCILSNYDTSLSRMPQRVTAGEKYGAVTLRTNYRRSDQRLRVEVLNAANLLPMDSNGET